MNNSELASLIDHTLLKPDAKIENIVNVCDEAKKYQFASVCVNPYWVKVVSDCLKESDVKVCTVIGFPLGNNVTSIKVLETRQALEDGAEEIDMVINLGAVKSSNWTYVENDIKAVVNEAKRHNALVKVILENCLLTDDEKKRSCEIVVKAEADFVKTSTGFSTGGATVEDVKLMRKIVGENFGVKASGGVRDRDTAIKMIEAGANRIGASSSLKIIEV